ncbi:MAG TPA: hypothetical protein VHN37_00100 [Actinomycetota bacterium]|nr:hypothetical protein [Actinomycetota bacterium]
MDSDTWRIVLVAALLVNAAAGLGYRVYRLAKGGPRSDVVGQSILGALLVGIAAGLAAGAGWPRWPALVYGLLFGVVVMPIWVLAVLIPLRPRAIDYAFTAVYWTLLAVIVAAALAG